MPYGYGTIGSGLGVYNDPVMQGLRDLSASSAANEVGNARLAAKVTGYNDPSLAGWAGLTSMLGAQGQASRGLMGAGYNRLNTLSNQSWQEYMAKLAHQWKLEEEQSANRSALWASLLGLGGAAAGGWASRR